VRGVETARYRLRRKFGISSETSLVNFLIDFK
jgi:DNA-binding CsgD family transcriptional regulator